MTTPRIPRRRLAGFSIVELVIAMLVGAILLRLAISEVSSRHLHHVRVGRVPGHRSFRLDVRCVSRGMEPTRGSFQVTYAPIETLEQGVASNRNERDEETLRHLYVDLVRSSMPRSVGGVDR